MQRMLLLQNPVVVATTQATNHIRPLHFGRSKSVMRTGLSTFTSPTLLSPPGVDFVNFKRALLCTVRRALLHRGLLPLRGLGLRAT